MATTVFIDGSETPLSAGQTTQTGGTQGPNATHNSTGAAGEFIGANFTYVTIGTPDISGSKGIDSDGNLEALPSIVNVVASKATVVVVNNATTATYMILEGPHGWNETSDDLRDAIRALGTVDSISLAAATATAVDALVLA